MAFAVLPVLLLRLLYSQLWITVSRHQTARSRHRIVNKSLGHCNFELVPRLLFDVFPPLKYLMYTPSFHSLHHTQFRSNYSLFMPLYDHLYGTALCEREIQVHVVDKDLYESVKQQLRPETHEHLLHLAEWWSHSAKTTKVWLVGDRLTGEEQRRAQGGAHFVPYSQFPPGAVVRADCVYHSTPALVVPDAFEDLHACRTGCRGG
ncbi:Protein ECERIFERUM 1 [Zea mays]|uniref:Protein ECERIFERUM 1 n=1 Tax=Zea mays TaxID=4577 RepID=A0A1D6QB12_MAIZE|nr:Protein ECERIFERUM 1 [Zea mays]